MSNLNEWKICHEVAFLSVKFLWTIDNNKTILAAFCPIVFLKLRNLWPKKQHFCWRQYLVSSQKKISEWSLSFFSLHFIDSHEVIVSPSTMADYPFELLRGDANEATLALTECGFEDLKVVQLFQKTLDEHLNAAWLFFQSHNCFVDSISEGCVIQVWPLDFCCSVIGPNSFSRRFAIAPFFSSCPRKSFSGMYGVAFFNIGLAFHAKALAIV